MDIDFYMQPLNCFIPRQRQFHCFQESYKGPPVIIIIIIIIIIWMSWLHVRLSFILPSPPFALFKLPYSKYMVWNLPVKYLWTFLFFVSFRFLPLKNTSNYLFHFTFIKLLAIFYRPIQRHLIGYHHYCRLKDQRSFKLFVDGELRETTLKLSSGAFEE